MLSHHASVLALGVLCLASFGCGGSGVSLGDNGSSAGAGGSGAGAPGAAGESSAGSSAGGSTHTNGGASGAGAPSGGGSTNSAGATSSAGAPSSAGASGSAGAAGSGSSSCQDPVTLGGNWISCKNGLAHRTTPGACEYKPRTTPIPATGPSDQCTLDSQCTAMPNGYCSYFAGNLGRPNGNVCAYACLTDADCGAGKICECGAVGGACKYVTASCKSDMDCMGGALCTNYDSAPGCSAETFACQTPSDQCAADADCPQTSPICTVTNGHRVCVPRSCAF
ncbi:MAG TPA: hypothetical protein VGL19_16895 [Polyangiaceae bacterium]